MPGNAALHYLIHYNGGIFCVCGLKNGLNLELIKHRKYRPSIFWVVERQEKERVLGKLISNSREIGMRWRNHYSVIRTPN